MADEQTGGKGRLGRTWHSPPGNLHTTLLCSIDASPTVVPQLGFVAALAVHDVASAFTGADRVFLKWPNDCLVNGAKVAGILCEAFASNPTIVAIGCGINVTSAPQGLPYPAATLAGARVEDVFSAYRSALEKHIQSWDAGAGFSRIAAAWRRHAIGINDGVSVVNEGKALHGTYRGISGDGALLLETPDGLRQIYAGDVKIPSLLQMRNGKT